VVNLSRIGYRSTSKMNAHGDSQSTNKEKGERLLGYSAWLSRYPHLKLERLKIRETYCVNGCHWKNILNTRISRHLLSIDVL